MLSTWNDFDRTFAMLDELRRRFERGTYEPERAQPAFMTLRDQGKELVLTAVIPGIPQENLKVSLHNETLTISGERTNDLPDGYEVHRRERYPIQFSRSFNLPVKVDPERTRAELKDGVLTLKLEKAAEAQPRMISVKAV